jgi:hypothetical protein
MLTDAQIQAMFRYCKDVDEQVAICSQLTGKSEEEICEIVGIDPIKRTKKPRAERKLWTAKEVENLCTAYRCKVKTKTIADMLDRPLGSVKAKIAELKIKGILKDE